MQLHFSNSNLINPLAVTGITKIIFIKCIFKTGYEYAEQLELTVKNTGDAVLTEFKIGSKINPYHNPAKRTIIFNETSNSFVSPLELPKKCEAVEFCVVPTQNKPFDIVIEVELLGN